MLFVRVISARIHHTVIGRSFLGIEPESGDPVRKTLLTLVCSIVCAGLFGCSPFPSQAPNETSSSNSANTVATVSNATDNQTTANTSNGVSGAGSVSNPSNGSTTPPPPPTVPLLKIGSKGNNVYQLNELLAKTGYLPLTYSGNSGQGTFSWTYKETPAALRALWSNSAFTLLTKSAVMTFESVHGLAVDGIAGQQVWSSLKKDAADGKKNPYGFTFVEVTLNTPQKLILWHNGVNMIQTAVNSGISQSPTVKGTYPVYLQYRTQTMSGTDVFGHHYSDPGVPYVSYFYGGEAIHGFPRAAYGYPQSLGCVELPVPAAKRVWPYMHLGTLVHIS